MKTYLKLVSACSIIFFLFAFGLSYGNRLATSDHTSLSRSAISASVTREIAETTKIMAEANKTQAEADSIISETIIGFGKGVVVIAVGVIFVVFLAGLSAFAMSMLNKQDG